MQTRPELSWANCVMCAVECRDTPSGPAIAEWSCEKKRRVLTLPRALHPRPCGQVLREIELAVSVNKLKTRPASLRTASNSDFPKVSSGVRCGILDPQIKPDSTVLNSESSCSHLAGGTRIENDVTERVLPTGHPNSDR